MKSCITVISLTILLILCGANLYPQTEVNKNASLNTVKTDLKINQPGTTIDRAPDTDFILSTTQTTVDKMAGDTVCFTITAKDKDGNVIRDWKNTGYWTTLILHNSTANTDTSMQSWNANPFAFTYAQIIHRGIALIQVTPNEWTLPSSAFDDSGQCEICLIHTKAENDAYIEIILGLPGLIQESGKVNFKVGEITNFLVEITSSTPEPDQVYLMRPYEVVVSPRDRYMNVSSDTITAKFSARFPDEFVTNTPGLTDIFSGEMLISGPMNYLIASTSAREKTAQPSQIIYAYASADTNINGSTNGYEILDHAPNPFALLSPPDHKMFIITHDTPKEVFSWEQPNPPDPYTNITISRFTPGTASDEVRYTWIVIDSLTMTKSIRIDSDSGGVLPYLTLTHFQLRDLMYKITSLPTMKGFNFIWSVEATDGLYTAFSTPSHNDPNPRPGRYFCIIYYAPWSSPPAITPAQFALQQNYPNPFNPTTSIAFSLPNAGKVSLKVFDLIGGEVATILEDQLSAGEHTVTFNASNLPTGIYIYKLQVGGKTLTRRMTLLK